MYKNGLGWLLISFNGKEYGCFKTKIEAVKIPTKPQCVIVSNCGKIWEKTLLHWGIMGIIHYVFYHPVGFMRYEVTW